MATPGMLFVTMQPRAGLSLDQFHEWYNNEHGPTRLRMPDIFTTGQRYRVADEDAASGPPFLATYDVTDMAILTQPVYTDLRAHRSPREAATIGQVEVKRYMFDFKSAHTSPDYVAYAAQTDAAAVDSGVLVHVEVSLKDVEGAEAAVARWYEEEHFAMLAKVPGWRRSRLFRTSTLDLADGKPLRLVSLHEYARVNGLGGPEHKASMATQWRADTFDQYIVDKSRRTWGLFYVFGPAPRDLEHLARLPPAAAFVSADAKTSTTPPPPAEASASASAVLCSYATTPDGLEIPYRLEGNPAPDAPTVAFCNSLLTSLHMWDDVVALVKANRPDLRILRYDTRGRHAIPSPPVPATMEMLADDLCALLTALRIPQLEALIGVSMGGATTLQFALKYPGLLKKYIACDCNIAGSDANTAAWKDRIVMAEAGPDGMKTLAGVTVSRWVHPLTMTTRAAAAATLTDMVAANNLEGFKYSCQSLWTFNLRDAAKTMQVPGLLVVGEGDGKGALVKAMDGYRPTIGKGDVELKIVPDAGHLPMYENPAPFWDSIKDFL